MTSIESERAASARLRPGEPPSASLSEPRSWAPGAAERGAEARTMAVPLPHGRRLRVTTDRVRARPAVSPQLSLMLGQNALGLAAWGLLAPKGVNRFLGLDTSPQATQLVFGLRELATGLTLTSDPTRADALWARVAGDALDIAVLAPLTRADHPKRGNARFALGAVLAVTLLDIIAAVRMTGVKRVCD